MTYVDAVLPPRAAPSLDLCEELARLAPFGLGNPEVTLLAESCELRELSAVGDGKHLRFRVAQGGAIAFGLGAQLDRFRTERRFDVAFRLQANHWNGTVAPQLVVRRIFDAPDRYTALREWLAAEFRKDDPDVVAQEIFDELGVGEEGVRRSLLESERFRRAARRSASRSRAPRDRPARDSHRLRHHRRSRGSGVRGRAVVVVDVVTAIRASSEYRPAFSLVAEENGEIVGHVMLSGLPIEGGHACSCHRSPFDRTGSGGASAPALVEAALAAATDAGERLVCVEGDPRYYSRFGFRPSLELGVEAPTGRPQWAFQAIALADDHPRGRATYSAGFRRRGFRVSCRTSSSPPSSGRRASNKIVTWRRARG